MAADKHSVTFELTANDKTAQALSTVRQRFEKLSMAAVKGMAVVAAATAAAGYAVGRFTKAGLDSADALAKQAARLNMTNAEMRAFELLAAKSGVEAEKLAGSVAKMSIQLSNMRSGGASNSAIRELGLDIDALAQMRPAQQFAAITEAIGRMTDRNRQAAIAAAIFRDRAGEMLGAIRDGKAGMTEALAEVEKYNLALSADKSAAIERVNNQFATMGKIVGSLKERFAAGLAPALEEVNGKIIAVYENLNNAIIDGAFFTDMMIAGTKQVSQAWARFNIFLLQGQRIMLQISKFSIGLDELFGGKRVSDMGDALADTIAKITEEIELAKIAVSDNTIADWYSKLQARSREAFGTVATVTNQIAESSVSIMADVDKAVSASFSHMERAMVDAFMTGTFAARDMARNIIREIMAVAVRAMILRPIFGAIGGFFGAGSVLGSAFNAAAGVAPPGRSMGGSAQRGVYRVGENGPENVYIGQQAYIQPKHAANTSSTVVNIDARGADVGVVARIEQALAAVNASIESRAIRANLAFRARRPA
jgi:hypothetical protein